MANRLRLDDLEYGEALSDSSLAQFLATKHWTIQRDRKFDQVWVEPGAQGDYLNSLVLPRDSTLADYSRRLQEAVEAIAETYKWSLPEVAEQVAATRADLFFIRIDQHMSDGTIPLRQASQLLESVDQLIRSSAILAYNPHSSGRGRMAATVSDFLADDVRMGHTKKGSFIITVAARLDDIAHVRPADTAADTDLDGAKPSFTRQVMTTLARSLSAAKESLAEDPLDRVSISEAIDQGLRLPIIQALEDISEAEGLRSIDMSFEWAPSEPQREALAAKITIDRSEMNELPRVREGLVRTHHPEIETIVGPVTELRRPEAEDGAPEGGEIVIRADLNGRLVRVTIPLVGADYEWAIRAHQAKLPVTVTGELGRKGNSWRMLDQIELDRSFLEHYFASN